MEMLGKTTSSKELSVSNLPGEELLCYNVNPPGDADVIYYVVHKLRKLAYYFGWREKIYLITQSLFLRPGPGERLLATTR